jgi:hypothetical protein
LAWFAFAQQKIEYELSGWKRFLSSKRKPYCSLCLLWGSEKLKILSVKKNEMRETVQSEKGACPHMRLDEQLSIIKIQVIGKPKVCRI